MSDHHHCKNSNCCKPNPNVCQNLEEMEFERGIWQAAIDNNVERLRELFSRSPNLDPDILDSYGYTALNYAARNGNLDAAKYLLDKGADINRTTRLGQTPLHRAILNSKIDMINLLISKDSRLDIKDDDGFTPLEKALEIGNEEIIKTLKTAVALSSTSAASTNSNSNDN